MIRQSTRLDEVSAERDRLRAELATCGKDWADERRSAQAEAAALRAEVAQLVAALKVARLWMPPKAEGRYSDDPDIPVVDAALAQATATEGA